MPTSSSAKTPDEPERRTERQETRWAGPGDPSIAEPVQAAKPGQVVVERPGPRDHAGEAPPKAQHYAGKALAYEIVGTEPASDPADVPTLLLRRVDGADELRIRLTGADPLEPLRRLVNR